MFTPLLPISRQKLLTQNTIKYVYLPIVETLGLVVDLGMRRYITLLLFVGFAWGQYKLDINNLIDRDGVLYAPNKNKPFSGSVFDFYENGTERFNGRYRNGIKNGKWTWWNEDGGVDSTGRFKKGLKNGQWKYYYTNGILKGKGQYRVGSDSSPGITDIPSHGRHGEWTFWHENALKASEITYNEGERVGIWISWNDQGQKVWEGTLEDYNAQEAQLVAEARLAEEKAVAEKERKRKTAADAKVKAAADAKKAAAKKVRLEKEARDWFNKGYDTVENGEYNKAILFYKKGIELDPDYAYAYNNLGLAYKNQGNYTKAIESYEKATALDPDNGYAYINLGLACSAQGNYTKAIESYEKAIKLDRNYADAYNNIGNAYYNQSDYIQAIESYEKAIEVKPDYALAFYNMGNAYFDHGKPKLRLSNYKKAARLGHKTVQDWLKKNGHSW